MATLGGPLVCPTTAYGYMHRDLPPSSTKIVDNAKAMVRAYAGHLRPERLHGRKQLPRGSNGVHYVGDTGNAI